MTSSGSRTTRSSPRKTDSTEQLHHSSSSQSMGAATPEYVAVQRLGKLEECQNYSHDTDSQQGDTALSPMLQRWLQQPRREAPYDNIGYVNISPEQERNGKS
ncbi:hypothetical protein AUP68_03747 [Ilyonectria robusta]